MAMTKKTTKKKVAKKIAVKAREHIERPNTPRKDREQEVTEVLGVCIGHYITFKDKKVIPINTRADGKVTSAETKAPVVGIRLMVNLVDEDGCFIRDRGGKVSHVSVNVNTGRDAGRLDFDDDGLSDDSNSERQRMVDELDKRYQVGNPVKIKQTIFADNGWVDRDAILDSPWPKN